MNLDLNLQDERWERLDLLALATRAVAATLTHLGLDAQACEVSLLGCDDTCIARLNGEYRDKPTATNVLSWPAQDLAAPSAGREPSLPGADFIGDIALGDIAVAYDTCLREAEVAGISLSDHVTHLIVHGTLHLLGYDHIRDADATLMETLEVRVLGSLGVKNPYREANGAQSPSWTRTNGRN